MKGKTNIGIELSKTEMLAIGTEVEILDSLNGYAGVVYRCKLPKGKQVMINSNKVDITDYSPYINWEQRRYEIAKETVTAIMSNEDFYYQVLCEGAEHGQRQIQTNIARAAVIFADALIEELKTEK
ncbi:hypothetical protein K0F19_07665 [Bacteroides fragilis]|nr:hypothetical protein [Bacteroides fragilis]